MAPNLGNSRKIAVATLLQLEKRFQKHPELHDNTKILPMNIST